MLDARRAALMHDRVHRDAQALERALDAGLAKGAESPDVRTADAHRLSAHAERTGDAGPAPEAAVHQYRHAALHPLDDLRPRVDGRAAPVPAPRADVRDNDAVRAV